MTKKKLILKKSLSNLQYCSTLVCVGLLLGNSFFVSAEENDGEDEAIKKEKKESVHVIEYEDNVRVREKQNPGRNSKGSVKMIVGGQSEGGVAKQVTLPVKD